MSSYVIPPLPPRPDGMTALEAGIAASLDEHGIAYTFNLPQHRWPGVFYQPDFVLHSEPPRWMELPRVVEGKPQRFIQDFYNLLRLERKFGETFNGALPFFPLTPEDMRKHCFAWEQRDLLELVKPLEHARASGSAVLVCSTTEGSRTKSVTMTPDGLVWRRDHPFVNQATVRARIASERRRAEYEARWAEQAREREKRMAEQEAARIERLRAENEDWDKRYGAIFGR